ncbi:MAG: ABC transporter ATP-binding protein [Gloeobacteraceae cyanobacterium ES-bin-144]|nr:ABC transporter ATP-binding protein [Verrucomicrobiales bacterium]
MKTDTLHTADHAIEIRGLRKHYPGFNLGPIDLNVPKGSIFGFVGPNGAGKSTTIDLMFGMGRGDAGAIRMLGLNAVTDEVAVKSRAAYVGPELDYRAWGKIAKAIRFVRGFYRDTWDDAYCEQLLDRFKLDSNDKIATLSFGSRTKLALVIALSRRPELLVLDEPTVGLDAIAKRELFVALLDLVKDTGHTILISSHNLSDVERFADHVAIINDGLILHAGPMDDVIEPFCIADFILAEDKPLVSENGITVIMRQGTRARVLVDRKLAGLENLAAAGARDLTHCTVNLEELFISLLSK